MKYLNKKIDYKIDIIKLINFFNKRLKFFNII